MRHTRCFTRVEPNFTASLRWPMALLLWWALSDLNGRPFGCKPNALTAELSALTELIVQYASRSVNAARKFHHAFLPPVRGAKSRSQLVPLAQRGRRSGLELPRKRMLQYICSFWTGRGRQVVRQRSAKPLSAVRFRLAPPIFLTRSVLRHCNPSALKLCSMCSSLRFFGAASKLFLLLTYKGRTLGC